MEPTSNGSCGALAKAMAKAQSEMADAVKDGFNPHFKSKYATLASVREAVRKPLSDNALAVTQTFTPSENGTVTIVTTLMHESGESIASVLQLPVLKNDAQSFGSAISYGRRYSLAAICGIADDEDDDGNGATQRPPEQRPAQQTSQPPPAKPAQQAAPPPQQQPALAKGRKDLGEALMNQVGGDRAKYQDILRHIIPGMTSLAGMSDLQFDIVKMVVDAAVVCDTPMAVHATKNALMKRINTVTPVEQWTAANVLAVRESFRADKQATGSIYPPEGVNAPDSDCPF